jgi:hypothetical protein
MPDSRAWDPRGGTVVVDPQGPEYAELPGGPYSSSAEWEIPLVIGLGCMLIFPVGLAVAWLERG